MADVGVDLGIPDIRAKCIDEIGLESVATPRVALREEIATDTRRRKETQGDIGGPYDTRRQ